ncbi:tRNA uracil 4-sulfurtransferase ThiI [Clostridium algidicarnis]|uniref:Probable tRNA sulfurtransferase n=2 Tax=Clostridium algidicarnis TaxID=37659 RepID=A0A2S6FWK7_9CLOT|nr:tRNA uracil 4-sulfurtransferase ThiI [Clostridium algidicarnis]MBB6631982.1 tRNA 4-thiouridine(8) synthase ThiI [Clostridium algidicarnis]MBB6697348.1 tRNA 4-thiouridine(8) synthase ThiI [Clostridium algidicarnis]MBU3194613.1 tRNA 4-thiouridine(8) synthase ThiI [Clostridium algidicarnis]MBU3206912.1 tRNA 4-thiouridine(8) synthase ThiI [Clostridium algidicarnis]MBU3219154.1 tRNA 4-thiouridine(8) synthase ThiI [Clostridium algidicarnis]
MKRIILVKYASEIFLKGLNRNKFEKKLKENIKKVLKDIDYEFITDQNRWFIAGEDLQGIIDRVKRVFGIAELCIVRMIPAEMEEIKVEALKVMEDINPHDFKVETKRANKEFPINSLEVSRELGSHILSNMEDMKVNVSKPEYVLNIEIRKNAYVYEKKIKAIGGMPYGMNGSTMLMLSGGFDSPVAGYLMGRRGVELSCVYYHSSPYTSERAKEKVKDLSKILASYTGHIKLYVVPFTDIQMGIVEKCREDELTIIMRRFMMRLACELASVKGIDSVTTGESVGQVASQTMAGLIVSDDVADRPVFRPLIAMDKNDIMDVAREVGTYDTSILPYEDCCTIFVPKHPKTKPRLKEIIKSEEALDIELLVKEAINNTELIEF